MHYDGSLSDSTRSVNNRGLNPRAESGKGIQ